MALNYLRTKTLPTESFFVLFSWVRGVVSFNSHMQTPACMRSICVYMKQENESMQLFVNDLVLLGSKLSGPLSSIFNDQNQQLN